MSTIPTTHGPMSPSDIMSFLDFQSKAYNVGYALGYTREQIDNRSDAELHRWMRVAEEAMQGRRDTAEHERLATRPALLKWIVGER